VGGEGGILGWFEALGAPPGQIGWTDIEYVYGPDYVDEFAFILNEAGQALYVLQDANYNVMGVTNATGGVVEQYAWSPYGELIAVDPVGAGAPRHVPGHQGLFFVRLDGSPADPSLEVGTRGLYYNRNRWYSSHLGRFLQRDVNETALPILAALAFNGEALDSLLNSFEGQSLYADGLNLYVYLGSNPVNGIDALGLEWWLLELPVTAAEWAHLEGQDAARVSGMAALLFTLLGAAYADMQWGVMGMGSSGDFDRLTEGVHAFMTGAYAYGESLIAIATGVAATEAFSEWDWLGDIWGIPGWKIGDAIERLKKDHGIPPNVNVRVDPTTGNVFVNGQKVGNLRDYL
jgi:RHS repeat-associated protein